MTDPIADAGLSLREDPTYALMTQSEREAEARALLTTMGSDASDPLNVALVLEEAAKPIPITPPPVPNRDRLEGCGEKRTNCGAPIAANGRCMECGARRGLVAMTPLAPETPVEAPPAVSAPTQPESDEALLASIKRGLAINAKPRPPLSATPPGDGTPLLYRFKAATGLPEPILADLIGKSRATVQAYISGRLPELLDDTAKDRMCDAIAAQIGLLVRLQSELGG